MAWGEGWDQNQDFPATSRSPRMRLPRTRRIRSVSGNSSSRRIRSRPAGSMVAAEPPLHGGARGEGPHVEALKPTSGGKGVAPRPSRRQGDTIRFPQRAVAPPLPLG